MKSARFTASAISVAALTAGTLVLTAPPAAANVVNTSYYNCDDGTINNRFDFNRLASGKLHVQGGVAPIGLAAGQVHINWGSYSLTNPAWIAAGDPYAGGPVAGVATMTAPPTTLTMVIDWSPSVPNMTFFCTLVPDTLTPGFPWAV